MKLEVGNTAIIFTNLAFLVIAVLFFFVGKNLYQIDALAGAIIMAAAIAVALFTVGDTLIRIFWTFYKPEKRE